jgi:hypothetical protein
MIRLNEIRGSSVSMIRLNTVQTFSHELVNLYLWKWRAFVFFMTGLPTYLPFLPPLPFVAVSFGFTMLDEGNLEEVWESFCNWAIIASSSTIRA